MARTSRELAIAHGAQFAAQSLLCDNDAEFLPYPLAEIDDPPSDDPMNRRDRTALDDRGQRGPMSIVSIGALAQAVFDRSNRPARER